MMVIVPFLQMQAVIVDVEPVERAVGDGKIARGVKRPSRGAPIQDIEHSGMRDRRDGLSGMMTPHGIDRPPDPACEIVQALAGLEIVICIAASVMQAGSRMQNLTLRCGDSLENAVMPLPEFAATHDFEFSSCREHGCGVEGPDEIGAVDGGKLVVGGIEGHRHSLPLSGFVERDVCLSLDALFHIPVGFAMSDEADPGGHLAVCRD